MCKLLKLTAKTFFLSIIFLNFSYANQDENFIVVAQNAVNWLMGMSFIIGCIFLCRGVYFYLTPHKDKRLYNILIGLFLTLGVSFIFQVLGFAFKLLNENS